jgi:serine/threonine protein phosphatase PrpC
MQTDVGRVRARNEDAAHIDEAIGLFIVADGMGGHGGGDVASALAVSTVSEFVAASHELVTKAPPSHLHQTARSLLERAVRAAHGAVLERSQRDLDVHNMGTTIDVMLVYANEAFIAHVGDSRTYLVRQGVSRRMTNDHTVAEIMRRSGQLTDEEAAKSPLRTVLCNSVGCAPDLSVEHSRVTLRAGDCLLMCSDGLYDYFEDEELALQVSAVGGEQALAMLTKEACARGGHDNITGIVVAIGVDADAADTTETLGVITEHVVDESSRPHQ